MILELCHLDELATMDVRRYCARLAAVLMIEQNIAQ